MESGQKREKRRADEFLGILTEYSYNQHKDDLVEILLAEDSEMHYAVVINTMTLFATSVETSVIFLSEPENTISTFDRALVQTASLIYSSHERKKEMVIKTKVHARLTGLPLCTEITRNTIPKNADAGKFLLIHGTVIRTSGVKLLEFEKIFTCSKCKKEIRIKADIEQYYTCSKLTSCPTTNCKGTKFTPVESLNNSRCRDYQEIKLQEQVQKLSIGTIPRSMSVILEDDLVRVCKPGDDVEVSGIVMRRWQPLVQGVRPVIELFLKANYIRVINNQRSHRVFKDDLIKEFQTFWRRHKSNPLEGRNHILMNFCPQVYGLYLVKLAVATVVAGGVTQTDSSGTRVRGEPHLLLVGDPGTGKSQFLKYAVKLCPRSVLTTGIGSTSAGLTVTAIKDGGEWQLEAGALVLADGGLCCIDEFNSIRESDKTSIHEAMEQQTISVAKAGLVCTLNTRCTIIASTNPKGNYDTEESINVNTALASPLLSRFDLILVLLDRRNENWDRMLSTYILTGRDPEQKLSNHETDWNLEKMKAYFCFIRTLQPVLSEPSQRILRHYYQCQRQADSRNAARTTVRLLESLIRLAQGHARLMFREIVTVQDAVVAIAVMEASMQGTSLIEGLNALHTLFPADAEEEYRTQVKMVLKRLKLQDILQQELLRLDTLKENSGHEIPDESETLENESEGNIHNVSVIEGTQLTIDKNVELCEASHAEEENIISQISEENLDRENTEITQVCTQERHDEDENIAQEIAQPVAQPAPSIADKLKKFAFTSNEDKIKLSEKHYQENENEVTREKCPVPVPQGHSTAEGSKTSSTQRSLFFHPDDDDDFDFSFEIGENKKVADE